MKELEPLFGMLWVALLIGSIPGAIILARKWVKGVAGRIVLSLMLIVVFWAASTVAVISGCTAVTGPVNFH